MAQGLVGKGNVEWKPLRMETSQVKLLSDLSAFLAPIALGLQHFQTRQSMLGITSLDDYTLYRAIVAPPSEKYRVQIVSGNGCMRNGCMRKQQGKEEY